jgi:hypothetical protein
VSWTWYYAGASLFSGNREILRQARQVLCATTTSAGTMEWDASAGRPTKERGAKRADMHTSREVGVKAKTVCF